MNRILFKKICTLIISVTVIISLFPKVAFAETGTNMESYDPRGLGIMTPVKNQNPVGVCWAFSGIGAVESFLKLNGYGEWDFSEEHARWWATYNDSGYGWNKTSREGGPTQIMPGYLTSWQGLKEEKDIPYTTYYYSEKPGNLDTAESKFNVTDIVYVKKDRSAVKEAILKYGAVSTTYYDSLIYLNNSTSSYYCYNENNIANHNVIIVGWNDNYSKENFSEGVRPQNDGAWLIKNSWGNNNSEGGYIWVSYEDKFILSQSANKINYAIKNVEPIDKNKKIYQYDEYGATSSLYLNNDSGNVQDMTYANVYDFDSEHEVLDEVMFNSVNPGAKYSLFYAPVVNNLPELTVDKMLPLGNGVIEDAGYMTIDIKDFILPKGKGAIVVYLDNRDNNSPVSLGCEVNLTYAGGILAYKADAKVGESYIYSENELIDINESFKDTPRSLTIKAITKKSKDAGISSVEVNGENITSTFSDDSYKVELPYSSINSKTIVKVTAIDQNAKITSINGVNKDSNLAEQEITIPSDGQVSPILITCQAADGTIKNYTLNISVSKEVKTSNDILKYLEIMHKDDISDIIKLNKNYDNLVQSEKEKLSAEIVGDILSEREILATKFQEKDGIKVSGVPWQVELQVAQLNEVDSNFKKIKKSLEKDKILAAYDISLIDHYTNLSYTNNGESIVITIPTSDVSKFENIRVVHLNSNGNIEYINPIIDGDKLTIKVNSFSPYAIIGQEKLKVSSEEDDNIKNIVDEKIHQVSTSILGVKSGDNSFTMLYVVLGIVSISVAIFIIINSNKNKNKRN